ncbi:SusC/RagA family TonB-linked outer membrane protein [Parafilimonas sp.]|uniref:SusC/RagA family TonB-linked outer membrane protein n=1 Tax=Parafilimonas sp. TaxID=1969739 RepID=UPI0039E49FA4
MNAQTQVTGTVTDSAGKPLSGVSVQKKNTKTGATTNDQGVYQLNASPADVLVFSHVGYQDQEITVGSQTTINVSMNIASAQLTDVVVVGYGTQRKIDVTGSVTQINGNEISKQGVVNPLSGLQGKVAGVQITNTGTPGSSPQITIRGLGGYSSTTAPLYVVDGVWFSDISFLNPNDIETMSILKDASSESIYGVRGANGVVLITTKKGASGKVAINYNGSVGAQIASNIPKMANGYEYAVMFNELTRLTGGTDVLDSSQFGEGTDWFDVALRPALMTNHQISVNGGAEKSTYNLSLGYLNQQGILKTNTYDRYTANFRNDVKISNHIKVGYNVIGNYSKSFDPPGSIWRQLYTAPPILSPKNADGSYGDPATYGLGSAISNPQVTLDYNHATTQEYHLNGNAYIDINFAKYFTWHSSIGGIYENAEEQSFTPVYDATSTQYSSTYTLSETRTSVKNWIIENTLTYNKTFGEHRITALAGQTAYRNFARQAVATTTDGTLSDDPSTWYFSSSNSSTYYNIISSDGVQTYPALEKVSSYFGRLTYSFSNRYTFTGTLRSDASSKFTSNFGRAFLPSFGVAWILSNESFMRNQKVFDALKLKASWGAVGNSGVPTYVATQTTTSSSIIYGGTGDISTGESIATLEPNPLKWEKTIGTDIGLEAALLANRLSVDIDLYNKLTKDFVFPVAVLASSGTTTSTILENVGDMRNRGIEIGVNWHDKINDDWSYSIGGNFSSNSNIFLKSDVLGSTLYSGGSASTGGEYGTVTKVGQPVGVFYGYKVIGIFQNQSEIDSYADADGNLYQPDAQPGDFKYESTTKSGPLSGNDRQAIGNPNPKYFYGINTSVSYKSFDLSLDFNGVADADVYNANKGLRYGNENWTKAFYENRWHGEGTSTTNPSVNVGGNENYYTNSWYVESGSYFRIRNIQLGYTLPQNTLQKIGIQNFRCYFNAQNPVIFTKYTGFTPEVTGNPGSRGIDNNVYPLAAIYIIGVNLTF